MSIVNAAPKGGACNLFLKRKILAFKKFQQQTFLK